MDKKDYDFPLYSFSPVSSYDQLDRDARFAIPVPGGRLIVRRELRRRGEDCRSDVVAQAVGAALAHHEQSVGRFAPFGLDGEWAGSMRHWTAYMMDLDGERGQGRVGLHVATEQRRAAVKDGQKLWQRLSMAAQLGGIGGTIVSGTVPRGPRKLGEALGLARRKLDDPQAAELLGRFGFLPEYREQLDRVLADLGPQREQSMAALQDNRRRSAELCVVRGALLGDLGLLCQRAKLVLPPELAAELTMQRLLDARRQPKPAPATPAA